jgi:hypothetical protein
MVAAEHVEVEVVEMKRVTNNTTQQINTKTAEGLRGW